MHYLLRSRLLRMTTTLLWIYSIYLLDAPTIISSASPLTNRACYSRYTELYNYYGYQFFYHNSVPKWKNVSCKRIMCIVDYIVKTWTKEPNLSWIPNTYKRGKDNGIQVIRINTFLFIDGKVRKKIQIRKK